jgi:hypothetical protein
MAPEIAVARLRALPPYSTVLDPMAGSGTVLRHASEAGHRAIGFDTDPLAVLMAKVWTTPVDTGLVRSMARDVVERARETEAGGSSLAWQAGSETSAFVRYWFGEAQAAELKRLAYQLELLDSFACAPPQADAVDCLRLALSRIIVTKDRGASLARDVSHSRPHKALATSGFEVMPAFVKAISGLCSNLESAAPPGGVRVDLGDARRLDLLNASVDYLLTSPPYLNAIDYMRGHRLALVWLGYSLGSLRRIRSDSIGAERAPDCASVPDESLHVAIRQMGEIERLPGRLQMMVFRYAGDLSMMLAEAKRVLRRGGKATFVVGNSCLRGVFISNAECLKALATSLGLTLESEQERDLPVQSRYLPPPESGASALGRRMRTESVLEFSRT